MARPICLRLLTHCARRAASRADWTEGSKRAIRTAMIAMTTSNSIRVKPGRERWGIMVLDPCVHVWEECGEPGAHAGPSGRAPWRPEGEGRLRVVRPASVRSAD